MAFTSPTKQNNTPAPSLSAPSDLETRSAMFGTQLTSLQLGVQALTHQMREEDKRRQHTLGQLQNQLQTMRKESNDLEEQRKQHYESIKLQNEKLAAEVKHLHARLERSIKSFEAQRADLQAENDRKVAELEKKAGFLVRENKYLQAQMRQAAETSEAEISELRDHVSDLKEKLAEAERKAAESREDEISDLRDEINDLKEKLAEAERKVAESAQAHPPAASPISERSRSPGPNAHSQYPEGFDHTNYNVQSPEDFQEYGHNELEDLPTRRDRVDPRIHEDHVDETPNPSRSGSPSMPSPREISLYRLVNGCSGLLRIRFRNTDIFFVTAGTDTFDMIQNYDAIPDEDGMDEAAEDFDSDVENNGHCGKANKFGPGFSPGVEVYLNRKGCFYGLLEESPDSIPPGSTLFAHMVCIQTQETRVIIDIKNPNRKTYVNPHHVESWHAPTKEINNSDMDDMTSQTSIDVIKRVIKMITKRLSSEGAPRTLFIVITSEDGLISPSVIEAGFLRKFIVEAELDIPQESRIKAADDNLLHFTALLNAAQTFQISGFLPRLNNFPNLFPEDLPQDSIMARTYVLLYMVGFRTDLVDAMLHHPRKKDENGGSYPDRLHKKIQRLLYFKHRPDDTETIHSIKSPVVRSLEEIVTTTFSPAMQPLSPASILAVIIRSILAGGKQVLAKGSEPSGSTSSTKKQRKTSKSQQQPESSTKRSLENNKEKTTGKRSAPETSSPEQDFSGKNKGKKVAVIDLT